MNILFYYPDKERSISLSSLMIQFKKEGHNVFLLTQSAEGDLHADVKPHGISVHTYVTGKKSAGLFYFRHLAHLVSFCRNNKIDLVYSHIQRANLIACLAQYFARARFLLCRHHSDCAYIDNNRNEKAADRIINLLGKEFIVPSEKVLDQMVNVEKVQRQKIHLIRYAYNFDDYSVPDAEQVAGIRNAYKTPLLLVKIARLITEKRHILLLESVSELIRKGLDLKLLLLSDGPERERIAQYITDNDLQNHIFMLGYRRDIMNYIAAADLVVHVSESEASSNLAKEVGLLKKPLLVCRNVGDFDEYLQNNVNALIIDKADPRPELEAIVTKAYSNRSLLNGLGEALHDTVIKRFSIRNIAAEYNIFHTKK